ncbi:MAG: undecaprenyldiphospho-muramoylpentapeptide beta-N-acetylglucosaminyltransferase [Spirochaetales bacterium]|nr:undecaprenyldiphospho-muramoylpentapeptide beta-N-acetylglucosaminyltransferase [Spirochaetales bacterium]
MKKCIAFTGGGTGGHVFPGLAVIDELKQKWQGRIIWIGSYTGMEKKLVQKKRILFYGIPAGKMRRYFSIHNFFDIFNILAGIVCAFFILIKERPACIFSKGGYVSVPVVLMGFLLRIPVITHESDFDPGIATRINSLFAKKVCISFKETVRFFPEWIKKKVIFTGNPVRSAIGRGDSSTGKEILGCADNEKILLVLGGSLGALAINRALSKILNHLTGMCFVVHQMGQMNYRKEEKKQYYPVPFFHEEFPHILAASDLVVSRAGANTLWELAATGKPSILIPLSVSGSRGDQIRNARVFHDLGASIVLEHGPALHEKLLETITHLFNNTHDLEEMGRKARSFKAMGALKKITDMLLKMAKEISV